MVAQGAHVVAVTGLDDQVEEPPLEQWVEPACRLVEDEQLRTVHERLHDADLLLVALRQPADGPVEVEVEALSEGSDPVGARAAA
ncbi:MAG TPA: hypothetical protein VM324_00210 [Egibacteraceae bacterium]|nr:hypothetical protein [Egibacteraceae bacterium]